MERSGKGLITPLGFKSKVRPKKYKKARHAIGNVSKKDISKITKEVKKIEKIPDEKKRPKHEPTDCNFYLARHLAKCMMRSDTLNWHDYGGYTKITAPSSNDNSADEDESKCIIVNDNLSQNCSMDESESKRSIVNKKLLPSCSTNEGESKHSIVNEKLSSC